MDTICNDTGTPTPESDVEALYDELFGTPALHAVEEARDEMDAYAAVYEVAKEHPAVARKAARDGTAAHYRGDHPFRYPVEETRRCGEVAP